MNQEGPSPNGGTMTRARKEGPTSSEQRQRKWESKCDFVSGESGR